MENKRSEFQIKQDTKYALVQHCLTYVTLTPALATKRFIYKKWWLVCKSYFIDFIFNIPLRYYLFILIPAYFGAFLNIDGKKMT